MASRGLTWKELAELTDIVAALDAGSINGPTCKAKAVTIETSTMSVWIDVGDEAMVTAISAKAGA